MVTKQYKVYGIPGHRQAISFTKSMIHDFSVGDNIRILEIENADKTGTNEYTIVRITRNTAAECDAEIEGQVSDGIFEDSLTGIVEEF